MQVYAGTWAAGGELHDVAVKVCPFTDRAVREAFHHEAIVLEVLKLQPNVITMVDCGAVERVGGALVLERAEGVPSCAAQGPAFAHLFRFILCLQSVPAC